METITTESGAICEIDLFGKKGLANSIKKLNWKISKGKIVDSNMNPIKCSICDTNLNVNNLTAFFPGSVNKVCSKPECFIGAIYETKKFE